MRRLTGVTAVFASLLSAGCPQEPARSPDLADRWRARRMTMVDEQLRARGINDARVLDAMVRVPRHLFVPPSDRDEAYGDFPLPIGHGQTISQPYIVAFMTEALRLEPSHRVLEIGTGSGYQAAVLAELAGEVFTIEIIAALAESARKTLADAGYRNVTVRTGTLVEQLKVDGLMAIPVGVVLQELRILRRTPAGMETLATLPVRFVPMTGKPPR
jgi:protein-L-isoaspartate(D-aspartate) O-methyltransferase